MSETNDTQNDFLKAMQEYTKRKSQQACPSCGHCPTCGHTPYRMYPWGVQYPHYQQPYYQPYTITWTNHQQYGQNM